MPIAIPIFDPDKGELVDTEFYDANEVGRMLHIHANTVRRYVREGRWPCLRMGHVAYMSAPMIGEAVESMTQHVGLIPESPPVLGVPLPEPDQEIIR